MKQKPYIISACEEPYFGINCSQKCNNCFKQSCHQVTGVCTSQVMGLYYLIDIFA